MAYCGCNGLNATATTRTDTAFTVTVEPSQTFINYKFYRLNLCLALVARTGTEPVAISDGTTSYNVLDTNGQPVVAGQLRSGHVYRIRFGAGGALADGTVDPHFVVYDGLCPLEYSSNLALQTPAEVGV